MKRLAFILVALAVLLSACGVYSSYDLSSAPNSITVENVPAFSGKPYIEIENNKPDFSASDLEAAPYEYFSPLDYLGRCGEVRAMLSPILMPTEERGEIGRIKPSGWHTVKYDIVDGKYLYNRCHLIGFQLSGENANKRNLITGTRYMNVEGMLPFENAVADYIKETGNRVLYRVTPVYDGENLLTNGVQIEAQSVEDGGKGVCFNVFVYNCQPGVEIDYATGGSKLTESENSSVGTVTYILNTNSKKYHSPDCSGAKNISDKNKESFVGTASELKAKGYTPCGTCKP